MLFSTSQLCGTQRPGRYFLRNSLNLFWNTSWDDRFYYPLQPDDGGSANRRLGTLRNTTLGNPEIWWRVKFSSQIDVYLSVAYSYLTISLRDSLTLTDLREHKSLDARLNFFSIGGHITFKKIPLRPYIGQSIGYCRGSLSTSAMRENFSGDILQRYILVDGSGGGVFFDLTAGVQEPIWRSFETFIEGRLRFTPPWTNFGVDSVRGIFEDWERGWAWQDRDIQIQGPSIAIGIQIRI